MMIPKFLEITTMQSNCSYCIGCYACIPDPFWDFEFLLTILLADT